jgi:hypothetical protein
VRSPKRTHAEIEEHHHQNRGCHKGSMVNPLLPARPRAPEYGTEYQHRQKKEDSGNLKPDLAAHIPEGPQKSAHAFRDPARRLPRNPPTRFHIGGCRLSPCIDLGLALAHDALARHASRDPQADAQYPSDGFRSHSDMMVAAADRAPLLCAVKPRQLPPDRCGSNVYEIARRSLRRHRAGRRRRYT